MESPLIIINDDDLPLSLLALHSTSTEQEEAYAQQSRNPADLLDEEEQITCIAAGAENLDLTYGHKSRGAGNLYWCR